MTFADTTVSLASWICMPKYGEENHDLLVRFTRALFKGMDYSANEHLSLIHILAGCIATVKYTLLGAMIGLCAVEGVLALKEGGLLRALKRTHSNVGTMLMQKPSVLYGSFRRAPP